jgi:hypothetical protein
MLLNFLFWGGNPATDAGGARIPAFANNVFFILRQLFCMKFLNILLIVF